MKKSVKKAEKVSKEKVKTTCHLELDGHIYFVEKDEKGNELYRDELPGRTALACLLVVLEDGLNLLERADRLKKGLEEAAKKLEK